MKLSNDQIITGWATLAKNNLEALIKACKSMSEDTKKFFNKSKRKEK